MNSQQNQQKYNHIQMQPKYIKPIYIIDKDFKTRRMIYRKWVIKKTKFFRFLDFGLGNIQ